MDPVVNILWHRWKERESSEKILPKKKLQNLSLIGRV